MKKPLYVAITLTLFLLGFAWAQVPSGEKETKAPAEKQGKAGENEKDKAVERTRRQVKMLDDIYKGGIVLITKHYVKGDEDLPAGTAFKKLFEAAKTNGWHEVRLVDATGDPYSDENVAISAFEKNAIKQLKTGKPFVDETVVENDKRFLLAATPIPVVMEKCTMCHSNYNMDEKGLVIGALTYRVPIDE